jgi:hypothetical protein
MPRRERASSKNRARRRQPKKKQPGQQSWLDQETSENLPAFIPVDLDDPRLSKETAAAAKRWLEWFKTASSPPPFRAGMPPPRAAINRPFGPPVPSKPKRKAKRGRRIEYNTDGGITAAAIAVAGDGVDDLQSDFIARVYGELAGRHIKAPGLTWMKKHIGPIHKREKRRAQSGR